MSKFTAPIYVPAADYVLPTGALAETANRRDGNWTSVALAVTTGQMGFQPIILRAGQVISSITFLSGGTTTMSGATHQWFCLCDSSRVQVATTHDDTNVAWSTNSTKTLAIEQIASGASGTYVVPSTGLYYLGYNVTATTMGTGVHQSGGSATLWGLAPIVAGTSETIATGPPSFAKTYQALVAVSKILYGYVS